MKKYDNFPELQSREEYYKEHFTHISSQAENSPTDVRFMDLEFVRYQKRVFADFKSSMAVMYESFMVDNKRAASIIVLPTELFQQFKSLKSMFDSFTTPRTKSDLITSIYGIKVISSEEVQEPQIY